MLKKEIFLLILLISLVSVMAVDSQRACRVFDDFSSSPLNEDKWSEAIGRSGGSVVLETHEIDSGVYRTEQTTAADAGIELIPDFTFQEGDGLEFDMNYVSSSGNHWGCAFWDEDTDWTEGLTCTGHWNEKDANNGVYGVYHYNITYLSNGVNITRTKPDSTVNSWLDTSFTTPSNFSIVTRTGDDGTVRFDYDNFNFCYTNYAPNITSFSPVGLVTIDEESSQEFTHTSTDINVFDVLTYSWKLDGIEQAVTQDWTYVTDYDSEGTHVVNLTVSDGDLDTTIGWEVTVNNVNREPVWDVEPVNQAIDEDTSLSYQISAIDSDGSEIDYDVDDEDFSISSLGLITWTPDQDFYGDVDITITASDGEDEINKLITITVNPINDGPVLAVIGDKEVDENVELNFTISAIDIEDDQITYEYDDLPIGANWVIDGSDRIFSWTPDYDQAGEYVVTFRAIDNGDPNEQDEETITITVNNINRAPVFTPFIANLTWEEDTVLSNAFDLDDYFSDPDGDILTYNLNDSGILEIAATIVDGVVSFSQTPNWYGSEEISFIASDGDLSTDTNLIILNVTDVPEPVQGSGGGGGRSSRCRENWLCGQWKDCLISGIQKRVCTDLNNCGTVVTKPEEERECEYVPVCYDGVQNGDEEGIDCGGSCDDCTGEEESEDQYDSEGNLLTGAVVGGGSSKGLLTVLSVLGLIGISVVGYARYYRRKNKII